MDPQLLLWVQVTLVWASVQAYERWVEPLDAADREELWAEAREVGRCMGIPAAISPPDWPALEAYWDRMIAPDGPIVITPTARRLAASIIRPPIPGLPGPAIELLTTPGLALLPPRIRSAYGIGWGPIRASVALIADAILRAWVGLVPLAWRSMPQARDADQRARAADRRARGADQRARAVDRHFRGAAASLQSTGPSPQEPIARA
jgi:uncharacterized protein (DUF2236 family)